MKISNITKIVRIIAITVFCSAFTGNLTASPISDARDAGYVKEMPNGYVLSKENASADIIALVATVNEKRKAAYEKIAKKNGLTAHQVGQESYRKRFPEE